MSDRVKGTISIAKDLLILGSVVFALVSGYIRVESAPQYARLEQKVEQQAMEIERLRNQKVESDRYRLEQEYVKSKLDEIARSLDKLTDKVNALAERVAASERSVR